LSDFHRHDEWRRRPHLERRATLASESIERLGVRRVHDLVTRLAMEIAPDKAEVKARAARSGRHVRVRLATDGMAELVAHLPAEQAAACFGTLHRAVKDLYVTAESVIRSHGQILADTLVERLTGQTAARDVNVEVQVLVPIETLLDPDSPLAAEIAGHGPIPAQIARELLATTAGKKSLRRLVTRNGIVIGGDSRCRTFDGTLRDLHPGPGREPVHRTVLRRADPADRSRETLG
jgi:hypothetical protein